ncbi:MAG TPA: pyridoxamine 5'-phosphate oxidase family protein [Acidimicrobiales bacterium]|nr:pyridoxamine 5'-phosphate oxidase family protein [Acidimicrobiales bacterium]
MPTNVPACRTSSTARPQATRPEPAALCRSRLITLEAGAPVCVTATIVDGLVLARSMFHHSMNYRCVTVFGTATAVDDLDEVRDVSAALVDHVVTGRSAMVRTPSRSEIRKANFLAVPIDEAMAKIRTGGPADEPEDLGIEVWAGHVPTSLVAGTPVAAAGVEVSYPH